MGILIVKMAGRLGYYFRRHLQNKWINIRFGIALKGKEKDKLDIRYAINLAKRLDWRVNAVSGFIKDAMEGKLPEVYNLKFSAGSPEGVDEDDIEEADDDELDIVEEMLEKEKNREEHFEILPPNYLISVEELKELKPKLIKEAEKIGKKLGKKPTWKHGYLDEDLSFGVHSYGTLLISYETKDREKYEEKNGDLKELFGKSLDKM